MIEGDLRMAVKKHLVTETPHTRTCSSISPTIG